MRKSTCRFNAEADAHAKRTRVHGFVNSLPYVRFFTEFAHSYGHEYAYADCVHSDSGHKRFKALLFVRSHTYRILNTCEIW